MKRVIIVLIIIFCKKALAREDLLENIRISKANEPELNDFLKSVLRHKEDFRWIRNAVDRIRTEHLARSLNAAQSTPDEEVEEQLGPAYGGRTSDEENIFFEAKPKRRSGYQHQYSNYGRPVNDVYPYVEPRYKRSFAYYRDADRDGERSFNEDDDQSNVKVRTRGDAGVRNVPGVKIQRNHRSSASCLGDHDSHEYVSSRGNSSNNIMGEYYYSSPHDLLGISQDLKCDKSRKHNETCVKTKKSIEDYTDRYGKEDRSIKVNIVDKGKLIKTVEQNENSNALVLTFKGEPDEEKAANADLAGGVDAPQGSHANSTSGLSSDGSLAPSGGVSNITTNIARDNRPLTAYRRLEMSNVTDDTLDNIDKILRHDQDSLKNSSYLPAYLKVKKSSPDEQEEEEEELPSAERQKETRMIKDDDLEPEAKLMVVRNRPSINEDADDDSKYRQADEYGGGFAGDPYNIPDQSIDVRNYEDRPILDESGQNAPTRQKFSSRHDERAYKDRRAHGYRGPDSEGHNKQRVRPQHRGRSSCRSDMKILSNGIEETVTQDPPVNKKNLLEDETEPTSAAEQRELEKKDFAKFGTPSMGSLTTERMRAIPLKKTYRGKPRDMEEYDDYQSNVIDLGERPELNDKTFHIKDSRDMIHVKARKSNLDDEVDITSNDLRSRELETPSNYKKRGNRHFGLKEALDSERSNGDDKPSELASKMDYKKRDNEHEGPEDRLSDATYSEKIRKGIKSSAEGNNDKINRREAINCHSDEDQYEQSVDDESTKEPNEKEGGGTFRRRRILSVSEQKGTEGELSPFDADLDYQNGISNAVNIRVKRTDDFGDVSDKAMNDDDDSGEYTNLGPILRYEKKHVIKPKNILPVDAPVMGAEDTIGLGDIPTCVNKRMDQDGEEVHFLVEEEEPGTSIAAKRKSGTEDGNKNSSHNDGNFEINESPKDIVVTKLKPKEENEFTSRAKTARKAASNSTKLKFKFNDDDSENHEDAVLKYRKDHLEKLKHKHKGAHHSLLDDDNNIRYQLMHVGAEKHLKHDSKHKLKNKKVNMHTGGMRDMNLFKKDVHDPVFKANESDKREMRQNSVDDDSMGSVEGMQLSGPSADCNDNRNELQIIEKDQAIIFKFTTPKSELGNGPEDNKDISESDDSMGSSESEEDASEVNREHCDSGEALDNPEPEVGENGEESDQLKAAEEAQCGPVQSAIRDVNGIFGTQSLDHAFGQEAKPADLSDDGELLNKILGLMKTYGKSQNGRDVGAIHAFEGPSIFIQNRSLTFDEDEGAGINHHLHKDGRAHPPKNKQVVCTKPPKHEGDPDDDAESLSNDEYIKDSRENQEVTNTLFRKTNPSKSMLKANNLTSNALDNVESFSDVVEKQNKAKRTKKNILDEDILPFGFDNLTQVEVEELSDSGKPTVRKKRYLKFLYKNTSKLDKAKSRRSPDSEHPKNENIVQRGRRYLNAYNMYKNDVDYGVEDYNNFDTKYVRDTEENQKPYQQNMYFLPSMQILPAYGQSNQDLSNVRNDRNRYDARRYNFFKTYRNASSAELTANNKTNASAYLEATTSSSSTKTPWDLGHNNTNATKNLDRKKENLKEIMNGQLIMNIIDKFTKKLKTNDVVYKRFGKRIPRHRAEMIVEKLSAYRDQQSRKDIKHAEVMLHQVIIMLNHVVMDQVHRKICMNLAPDLKAYLTVLTTNTCKGGKATNQIAEGYPLPELRGGNGTIPANQPPPPDDEQGDFLFESDIGGDSSKYKSSQNDVNSAETAGKKIHLIKKLLDKYNNMSAMCQVKVEPVKDYLIEHMDMLQKIKNKEMAESSETTTEINDSCEEESPKAKPKVNAVPLAKQPPKANAYVGPQTRSSTSEQTAGSSIITNGASSSAPLPGEPSPDSSSVANNDNNGESSIKVEARDVTPSDRFNYTRRDYLDAPAHSDEFQEDDARQVEAVKQKFIKNYGHGRFYPLSGRFNDPITHFQSELARENNYKEPYIMESNPFNLHLDGRPSYLASALDASPAQGELRHAVTYNDESNEDRNYRAQPEHNSMMLAALRNPLPVRKQRSAKSTHWGGSEKYQKLVEAATQLRRKREIEERIGKLFGARRTKYKKSFEYKPNMREGYPDLSKVHFETPLIYRVV